MRDYGVVKVRFWAWAKRKRLSVAARDLALYCLTAPHSNALGCYHLPISYIAEDLGTVPDTVRETLSELSCTGFVEHDDATGWIWLRDYLEHNPIANPNVGKSLVSVIKSVPRECAFYGRFVVSLKPFVERFPNGFVNGLANGSGNGSGRGMPNQDQDQDQDHNQEQDQEQEQDQSYSAPVADAPAPVVSAQGVLLDTPEVEPPSCDQAFALWNEAAKRNGWPTKRSLTPAQRRSLKARLKELKHIAEWRRAIEACERSDFLSGRKPSRDYPNWRLKLTFLLRDDKLAGILDGEYENSDRPAPQAAIHGQPTSRMATSAAVMARFEREENQR